MTIVDGDHGAIAVTSDTAATHPGQSPAPAPGRYQDLPGRRRAQAPLSRGGLQPRVAQAPDRGAEPAESDREGAGPTGRCLGTGHLSSRQPSSPGHDPLIRSLACPGPGKKQIRGKPGQAARQTADRIPAGAVRTKVRSRPLCCPTGVPL